MIEVCGALTRDHHDVDTNRKRAGVPAEPLPNPSLDAIARDGVPDAPTRCDSETSLWRCFPRRRRQKDERVRRRSRPNA
jgi:hypothetical protein